MTHTDCAQTAGIDPARVVATATTEAAAALGITRDRLARRMAVTNWGSVAAMYDREFCQNYKGYFPSCGMHDTGEATIAEVFDALAVAHGDARRAVRWDQIRAAEATLDKGRSP